jgi:hypothetical protein
MEPCTQWKLSLGMTDSASSACVDWCGESFEHSVGCSDDRHVRASGGMEEDREMILAVVMKG